MILMTLDNLGNNVLPHILGGIGLIVFVVASLAWTIRWWEKETRDEVLVFGWIIILIATILTMTGIGLVTFGFVLLNGVIK